MSKNIAFRRQHITNSNNNELTYKFKRPMTFTQRSSMAIAHMSLYFSWFNINKQRYNNNFFQYKFWDINKQLQTFDVYIVDGYYSVNTLNEYLQSVLISNGHYLINENSGKYKYFLELTTNLEYYGVEIRLTSCSVNMLSDTGMKIYTDTYIVPTTWTPPDLFETPEFIIPSNNKFGEIIGFSPRTVTHDLTVQPANDSVLSTLNDTVPNLLPSSSYLVTCDLIQNDMSSDRDDILHAFTINFGVGFGQIINASTDLIYSQTKVGIFEKCRIKIYDQDLQELKIIDPSILILLSFLNVD